MKDKIIAVIMGLLGTDTAKQLIGVAVNKLLSSKDDGITKDIAKIMIDGIAQSTKNDVQSSQVKLITGLLK